MHTINDLTIQNTLDQLHRKSGREIFTILRGLLRGVFRELRPEDMKDAYIAISPGQGNYLYDMLIERKATNLVEFGASFGISTIYLGAVAKQNGGRVISTELLPEKCRVAQENLVKAGVADWVDLREGDALQTLADNVPPEIDFLLLDGWNDLYLPLLQQLEPLFKSGTLIYIDNATFRSARPIMDYLEQHADRYRLEHRSSDKGGAALVTYKAG